MVRGLKLRNSNFGSGQASLESAFAVIVAIVLLLGATYIFAWMNKSMIGRQQALRSDFHSEYAPEKLNIFK